VTATRGADFTMGQVTSEKPLREQPVREGRGVVFHVGDATYDLSSFQHPGGELAMFGIANSPDPIGLLYQYHEFSAQRLQSILAPHCVSAQPATVAELERLRKPYARAIEVRLRIKSKLGPQLRRLRRLEGRFTRLTHLMGVPAFVAFALATAHGGALVQAGAVLLYAMYVHVVLVWNLHGQSHVVSHGADDALSYCISSIPFAPHSLAWFMQHTVLHHSFTGVALDADHAAPQHVAFDPDVRFSGVLRLSPDEEWLPHHRFQPLYAPLALGLTVWALLIDMVLLTTKHQLQLYEQLSVTLTTKEGRMILGFVLTSAAAVGGAHLLLGMPLWCFLLTMTLTSFSVGYVNIPTHTNLLTGGPVKTSDGEPPDYFAEQLAESTSYGGNISNLLTAGLSKQIEHHLYPNAPFCALPLLTPLVQAYAEEQGVQYRSFTSFGTCLVSWYKQVCFLAREPPLKPQAGTTLDDLKHHANHDTSSDNSSDTSSLDGLEVPPTASIKQYERVGAFAGASKPKRA